MCPGGEPLFANHIHLGPRHGSTTPQPVARIVHRFTLLWRGHNSHDVHQRKGSSLPATEHSAARMWRWATESRVPMKVASAHASVEERESSGRSKYRALSCCIRQRTTADTQMRGYFRGSMAGLCAPRQRLRRCPRRASRRPGSMRFATPVNTGWTFNSTPCRSPAHPLLHPKNGHCSMRSAWSHKRAQADIHVAPPHGRSFCCGGRECQLEGRGSCSAETD